MNPSQLYIKEPDDDTGTIRTNISWYNTLRFAGLGMERGALWNLHTRIKEAKSLNETIVHGLNIHDLMDRITAFRRELRNLQTDRAPEIEPT
jgi:hypothetical protein